VVLVMRALLTGVAAAGLVLAALPAEPSRAPAPPRGLERRRSLRAIAVRATDRLVPSARARRRDLQLPGLLDRLASALRAGRAIGPAFADVARAVPAPLGEEVRPIARTIEQGAPLVDALRGWAESHPTAADVQLVTAALTVGAGSGGEVARAVDGVTATLRERHQVRAELRALATQAQASAVVLAAAPVAFALLVATIEPGAIVFLLTTPLGLACLTGGVLLDLAGVVWMVRITRSAA
jgi:tight adherence protein B